MARTPKEITAKFRRLINEQKKAVDNVLAAGAQRMVSDVKSSIPKNTGVTAAAYKYALRKGPVSPVLDGPNTFHKVFFSENDHVAYFLEFGTTKMAPRPFLRPAYNRHIPQIKNTAVSAGVSVIKKFNN